MTLIAFALLFISSILHAGWNLFTKGRKLGIDVFMISFLFGSVAFLPLIIIINSSSLFSLITGRFILYVLVSSLFQSVYHIALVKSYAKQDLSFAYPLIRSLPVLLIALIQLLFFKVMLSPFVFAGIFLIITGSILLPVHDLFNKKTVLRIIHSYHIFIFLAAFGTVGYTLIDAKALSLMLELVPENPILMNALIWSTLQSLVDFIFLLFYMFITKKDLCIVFRKTDWRFGLFITIVMNLTHLLVLVSMYFVKDVSYVAAFRQISIPVGALFGFIFLKEKPYKYRVIGVTSIFMGLVLVVLT